MESSPAQATRQGIQLLVSPRKEAHLQAILIRIGTATFSAGPVYVEWLVITVNNTEVFAYDFAYGGATISNSIVKAGSDQIATFEEQVNEYFIPKFSSGDGGLVPWNGDNSIFTVFFGINE